MRRLLIGLALLLASAGGSAVAQSTGSQSGAAPMPATKDAAATDPHRATAIFAGGCFWCMESDFDKVPGVLATISGYDGGHVANPTYGQVETGTTGHAESEQVVYDPSKVSYQQLLTYYWHHIDPTVKDRQFCDVGNQYRTVIFVANAEQRKLAEASKKKVEAELKVPIYTQIVPAGPFYKAEEYHQDFYKKNPLKYEFYRWNCGRDQRVKQIWGAVKGES